MTVDGGSWLGQDGSGDALWNQSQDFIGTGTQSGTVVGAYDWDGVFNSGDITSLGSADCMCTQDSSKFTFGTPVAVNSTVTIWNSNDGTTASITLNEGLEDETVISTLDQREVTTGYPISFTGNLQSVKTTLNNISSKNYSYIAGIQVDGFTLVNAGVSGGGGETNITGSTETAEGTILQVEGTEVDLSASTGRWVADNKAGIPFSFVPSTPIVDTKNEAYGKLQIVGDKAMVTGIQADDPGFTSVTRKDYGITFPAAFATGNTPDDDLPAGTAISAIVQAKNSEGESIKESNILLPSLPNPQGSAGPVTGATDTELTVGTSANLDGFIANDALVMVDDTGAVASYTPQTSAIASVAESTFTYSDWGGGTSTMDTWTGMFELNTYSTWAEYEGKTPTGGPDDKGSGTPTQVAIWEVPSDQPKN